MPFCSNCGAQVEGRYCAKCGTAMDAAAQPAAPASDSVRPVQAAGLPDNTAAALCYIPVIVPILFLVLDPYRSNKLVRFHAFQSLFLSAVMVVLRYVFVFVLPWSFYGLLALLQLAFLVLLIFMFIQTYQGKRVALPVIGDLAGKQTS